MTRNLFLTLATIANSTCKAVECNKSPYAFLLRLFLDNRITLDYLLTTSLYQSNYLLQYWDQHLWCDRNSITRN